MLICLFYMFICLFYGTDMIIIVMSTDKTYSRNVMSSNTGQVYLRTISALSAFIKVSTS